MSTVITYNALPENLFVNFAAWFFCIFFLGCSFGDKSNGPVFIPTMHSISHGTLTDVIVFGQTSVNSSDSLIVITPLRADFVKRKLFVRVNDRSQNQTKEGWVNEGAQLIGFPGIGPLGAKLLKIRKNSAEFEFGFAEFSSKKVSGGRRGRRCSSG